MPQLDTIYILVIYTWTWFTLHLISQKIKTLLIITGPKKQQTKLNKPTPVLPWM